MVHKLIEIIGREAELFEKFLLLLEEQQKALVANVLEQIKVTTERIITAGTKYSLTLSTKS